MNNLRSPGNRSLHRSDSWCRHTDRFQSCRRKPNSNRCGSRRNRDRNHCRRNTGSGRFRSMCCNGNCPPNKRFLHNTASCRRSHNIPGTDHSPWPCNRCCRIRSSWCHNIRMLPMRYSPTDMNCRIFCSSGRTRWCRPPCRNKTCCCRSDRHCCSCNRLCRIPWLRQRNQYSF